MRLNSYNKWIPGCSTSVGEVLQHLVWQDANRKTAMKSGRIHVSCGWWGCRGGQGRLWCLAIFRFPFFTGQQQLKPDRLVHKHTPEHMNASGHAHTDFTLTWNSVVLRMWRPSGLHREESSPIEPSSILQCQSGCSRDHTCRENKVLILNRTLISAAETMKDWRWIPLQR